jgi:hypothetical protein
MAQNSYSDQKIPIRLLSKIKSFEQIVQLRFCLMRIEKNDVFFDFSIGVWVVYAGCCMVFNRNSLGIS